MKQIVALGLIVALLVCALASLGVDVSPTRAVASQRSEVTLDDLTAGDEAPQQGAPSDAGPGDDRVPVQVWTVAAAVLAAAAGLVLFLVRMIMGRVKPPSPQPDDHH